MKQKDTKLETLIDVPLRDIWPNEAKDFTPWLSENSHLLFEEIGIRATDIENEARAGKYFIDIAAEDSETGNKIIVENQLEKTNHSHLGQLLTYAASIEARIIVWVVAKINAEHQKAVEWLNDHTDEDFNFFLVKVGAYRIADSKPAPKFDVVVKPDLWSNKNLTDRQRNHLHFWENFIEYADRSDTNLKIIPKIYPECWYNFPINNSHARISIDRNFSKNHIYAGIYIRDSQELYDQLHQNKDLFEKCVGEKVEWLPLLDKKASRIRCTLCCDPEDVYRYEKYYEWILKRAEELYRGFTKVLEN